MTGVGDGDHCRNHHHVCCAARGGSGMDNLGSEAIRMLVVMLLAGAVAILVLAALAGAGWAEWAARHQRRRPWRPNGCTCEGKEKGRRF